MWKPESATLVEEEWKPESAVLVEPEELRRFDFPSPQFPDGTPRDIRPPHTYPKDTPMRIGPSERPVSGRVKPPGWEHASPIEKAVYAFDESKINHLLERFGKQFANAFARVGEGIISSPFSPIGIKQEEIDTFRPQAAKELEASGFSGSPPEAELLIRQRAADLAAAAKIAKFQIEPQKGIEDKVVDVGAGLAAFIVQLALLKKVLPKGTPDPVIWEIQNQTTGGIPGQGAAMRLALGRVGKIPVGSLKGKLAKVGLESGLFAGVTAALGGDAEDIIIAAMVPVAFNSWNFVKQRHHITKYESDLKAKVLYKHQQRLKQGMNPATSRAYLEADIRVVDNAVAKVKQMIYRDDAFAPAREKWTAQRKKALDMIATGKPDAVKRGNAILDFLTRKPITRAKTIEAEIKKIKTARKAMEKERFEVSVRKSIATKVKKVIGLNKKSREFKEFTLTKEGSELVAAMSPDIAAEIAAKEQPSRSDLKELGVTGWNAKERTQLASLFRDALEDKERMAYNQRLIEQAQESMAWTQREADRAAERETEVTAASEREIAAQREAEALRRPSGEEVERPTEAEVPTAEEKAKPTVKPAAEAVTEIPEKVRKGIERIRKIDAKEKELRSDIKAHRKVVAVNQEPPSLLRDIEKVNELQKQKADIWNEIRGFIPDFESGKSLAQLASETPNLVTVQSGKETHLSFFAEDIDKLLARPAAEGVREGETFEKLVSELPEGKSKDAGFAAFEKALKEDPDISDEEGFRIILETAQKREAKLAEIKARPALAEERPKSKGLKAKPAEAVTTIKTSIGQIQIPTEELNVKWDRALEVIFDYGNQEAAGKPAQEDLARSLSVGDTVEYEGKTWLVMPTAWQDVSHLSQGGIDKLVGEAKIPVSSAKKKPKSKGLKKKPAAKEVWEMTKSEWLETMGAKRKGRKSQLDFHKFALKEAVKEGKPVPRAVLEEYKSEKWAQKALVKLEKLEKPVETPVFKTIDEAAKYHAETLAEKVKPGETFYVTPQFRLEVKGKSRLAPSSIYLKAAGLEPAKDLNHWQKPAKPKKKGLKETPGEKAIEKPKKKGLKEEPGGGIAWQTAILQALKKSQKERRVVRIEQKKERRRRAGAYEGTVKWLMKKGVSPEEAIDKATAMLKGPLTEYQLYEGLDQFLPEGTLYNAYEDIATTDLLRPYERKAVKDAFKKLEIGAVLTPGEVKLIRKWRPEFAKIAEKRVPLTVRIFSNIEQALGLLKFGAAFDIQMRRQARWLRARHPVLFTKVVGKNMGAYVSKKYADKLAIETENDPRYEDAVAHGVKFLNRKGPERPEQYISYWGEKIPLKIGKTYAASMRGFIDAFNWLQQQLWNYKVEQWERQGVTITEEWLHDLADFNNTFLGMAQAKTTFGRSMRRVLAPVMWSPTLTWSRIRTPGMILTNKTMRIETAVSLASYIGSGLIFMLAASFLARALGKKDPIEWDPKATDFGKIRIGNTRIDIYGDGGPYIRAVVQLVYAKKKNQAGRLRRRPRLEVLKQFVRNKRAPFFDFVGKVWSGRNYYGGPAWEIPDWAEIKEEGGLKQLVAKAGEKITESKVGRIAYLITREITQKFAPFFVQSAIEASWHDGWPLGLAAGADEFFSGQALSYKPSTYAKLQMVQDISAIAKYDELWDDLSPLQQKRLRKAVPEINELEELLAREKLPIEEIDLREQNKVAERIRRSLPEDIREKLTPFGYRIIPGLSRRLGDFWLNDERYAKYEELASSHIEKRLRRLFAHKDWSKLDISKQEAAIKKTINKAKAKARKELFGNK